MASSRSLQSQPPLPAILESISRRKERLRATVVVLPSSCTAHHIQVSLIHALRVIVADAWFNRKFWFFLGKSTLALQLAKQYCSALLTIDTIVKEAIGNANTAAGIRARELCAEAARHRAEEMRQAMEENVSCGADSKKPGGLSMEAVAAHTVTTGTDHNTLKAVPSMTSNRHKTSTVSEPKSKPEKGAGGSKLAAQTSAGDHSNVSTCVRVLYPSIRIYQSPSLLIVYKSSFVSCNHPVLFLPCIACMPLTLFTCQTRPPLSEVRTSHLPTFLLRTVC